MSMAFARVNARTDGICLALTLLYAVKKATFCVGPRSRNDTDDEVEEDAGGLSRHAYFFCKIRTATCFLSRREVGRTSFVDTGRVDLFSLDPPPTLPVLWPLRCVVLSARKEDFERQGSRRIIRIASGAREALTRTAPLRTEYFGPVHSCVRSTTTTTTTKASSKNHKSGLLPAAYLLAHYCWHWPCRIGGPTFEWELT
jgi:hypothetical protein